MAGMIEVAKATVTIIPNMEGSQKEITKQLTGSDASSAGTASGKVIGKSMTTSIGSSLSGAGKTLTKSVTAPLMAIGTAAGVAWNEVDTGLDTIATKTGATGDALDDMGGIMKGITKTIPVGFEEAGEAVGEVNTRFGVMDEDLEDLSTQFLKFSKLNNQEVSKSVDNVSKVMSAFGVETKDAGKVLDALNTVGQRTGVDVGTLTTQLYQNAAQFSEMGLSADAAAGFLGAVDMAGLDSTTMMMGLKTAMKNATAENMTMDTALKNFQTTMEGNGTESDKLAAAYELFGTRAGAAIYNAVANGTLDLNNFTGSLEGFEGSVNSTFESVQDPADKFKTVINELSILGYEIAEAVMPIISDVVQTVTPIIQGLVDAWNGLDPGMQQFIVKAALVAVVAGPIISVLGGIFTSVGKVIGPITSLAGGIGNLAGKAGGAIGSLSGCSTSLSSMAGQALLLVALGAAVLLVAGAMSVLVNAAVTLASAGPAASAALLELAAVGTGMAAALALIGSVATVSAAGLLALGAAVGLVSLGISAIVAAISLVIDSLTNFATQLPTIAAYGSEAAASIGLISTQLIALAGSSALAAGAVIALGAGAAGAFLSFAGAAATVGLADMAIGALMLSCTLASAGILLLGASLNGINDTLTNICTSAEEAGTSLQSLVDFADAVGSAIDGLFESIGDFIGDFLDSILNKVPDAKKAGEDLGKAVVDGAKTGVQNLDSDMKAEAQDANNAVKNEKSNFQSSGKSIGEAVVNGAKTGIANLESTIQTPLTNASNALTNTMNSMKNSATGIMSGLTSSVGSSLSSLQAQFASTVFRFNSYIALPHFYMYGNFDARSRSVPSVGVSWYAQAATQGALFTDPTLIGVGDADQGELLIGEKTLFNMIMDAVRESTGSNIVINVYGAEGQNVNELARIVMKKMQQAVDKKEAVFA